MKLGLIARCDTRGGLAIQTAEAYAHLHPDRVLVVHADHESRGLCDRARYPGDDVTWLPAGPSPDDAAEFMDGLDVVFSCECLYLPEWVAIAKHLDVDVVVQANPEMYDAAELAGARVVLPTPWESHRVPHEAILPVPVALERFPFRQRTEARVFYHPTSEAIQDRNGTSIVLAALQYVTADVVVQIRGQLSRGELARKRTRRIPDNVKLIELPWSNGPYWEAYPPDADVLILPRRYGGLCLPMQEAAALGMPLLTTDLVPQREYPHAVFVDAMPSLQESMKIGPVMVHKADPRALAHKIDLMARGPEFIVEYSTAAREWAEARSWSALEATYRATLGE